MPERSWKVIKSTEGVILSDAYGRNLPYSCPSFATGSQTVNCSRGLACCWRSMNGMNRSPDRRRSRVKTPRSREVPVHIWQISIYGRCHPSRDLIPRGRLSQVNGGTSWKVLCSRAAFLFTHRLTGVIRRASAITGGGVMSTTREQLEIAIHLAEVGVVDRDFLSFIRSALRDEKRMPAGWNPVTGGPSGQSSSPTEYALALVLGRVANDSLLIDSARDTLMRHYASSQTSDIFGGWYRPGSSSVTYYLVAEDNTAVLLALR